MHFFFIVLCIFILAVVCSASTSSTSTKPARVTVSTNPSLTGASSTSNQNHIGSSSKVNTSNSNKKAMVEVEERGSRQSRSLPLLISVLRNVKDELQDIGEGFLFAESNSDRIDHVVDVVIRHRVVLGAAAGGYLLKNRIFASAPAQKVAKSVVSNLHAEEISKWGRRAAGGV